MSKRSVAIVVPDLSFFGGVPVVALFLHRVINESEKYKADLISISTWSRDENSVCLLKPSSWGKGVQVSEREVKGTLYKHVGAFITEFELQRYRPRKVLNEILSSYDIVQIVAGTPQWGNVAKEVNKPIALQIATLTSIERESIIKNASFIKNLWTRIMINLVSRVETAALRCVDVVFTENEWLDKKLRTMFGDEKVVYAPPGIDTDFFTFKDYHPNGHLISVGRFADPRKNAKLLFETYKHLREILPNAPKLVVAGENLPIEENMKFAEGLGILPFIEFRKGVSSEELRTLYQTASLYLMSSNEEGFGLVLAEAMACGLPVVSTRCGGPEGIVIEGETGYLVPLNDAKSLAESAAKILSNGNLAMSMSAAGRKRAVEYFSHQETGRKFLAKYDELLSA